MRKFIVFYIVIVIKLQVFAQHYDCSKALLICNKDSLVVNNIDSKGDDIHEGIGTCLGEGGGVGSDTYSKWLYWKAKSDGSLTFTIRAIGESDIDFAVFELPNSIDKCESRKLLRCNSSSPPCSFSTGLNLTDIDTVENFNCDVGENGFCKYIDMKKGSYYALFISNFTAVNFTVGIEWGGTGMFEDECSNGVNDNTLNEFRLFPNPVEDELIIENSNENLGSKIHFEILNMDQKVSAKYDLSSEKSIRMDVQKLVPGIYFLLYQNAAHYRNISKFIKY